MSRTVRILMTAGPLMGAAIAWNAEKGAAEPSADVQARIDALIEQMGRSDMDGKRAHGRLIAIGRPAVPALMKAADDSKPLRRWWALSALCTIGDTEAVDVVLAHMTDQHPTVRHVAIYNGKVFLRDDRRVAEAMTKALEAAAPGDALWAARALGDARYAPALPAIRKAVANPDPEVRWRVMEAALHIDGPGSIPFFLERLRTDTEPAIRRIALGCLARTDVKDQRTLDAHVGALRDRSPEVRVEALKNLQKMTGETFDIVPGDDVSAAEAAKVVRWWLANRERYPAVGEPSRRGTETRPGGA